MTCFKKFNGNFIEVVQQLGLSSDFYTTRNETSVKNIQKYDQQILLDLPRTCYVNTKICSEEMKTRLANRTHLDPSNAVSYTQGMLNGNFFPATYLSSTFLCQAYSDAIAENSTQDLNNNLSFSYLDADDKLCGVSINYLRDDSSIHRINPVPNDERKRPYIITIIRNTNAAPDNREVTYISHKSLLATDLNKQGDELNFNQLKQEVRQRLNSDQIFYLIEEILKEDSVSLSAFNRLKERLVCNGNIDDRDLKIIQLKKIISDIKKNTVLSIAQQDIVAISEHLLQHSQSQIDLFKHISFEDIAFLESWPKQSIFKDNKNNLLLSSLAGALCAGIMLAIGGVLAPLGLVIASTLSQTLLTAAALLLGLFTVNRVHQVINHQQNMRTKLAGFREIDFKNNQSIHTELDLDINKHLIDSALQNNVCC
ncbi:MAG: hypothetical protein ACOVQX_00600 [Legionella sp.]